MFEFLFNYPAAVWQDATLVFNSGWSSLALLLAVLLALAVIAVSLARLPMSLGRRTAIALLQGFAASVLLLMLWQPALVVQGAEKGENTVAWLLDASRSMAIEDVPRSRLSVSDNVSRWQSGVDLIQSLAQGQGAEYEATVYTVAETLAPVETMDALASAPTADRSLLAPGLETLLSTVGQSALAAVVLISDGSDNSHSIDAQWWQSLVAAGVPVHTVGTGRLANPDDLQLSDVVLPHTAAPDTQISARLKVSHAKGGLARVRVLAGNQLLAAEDINLPDGVSSSEHEISLPVGEAGVRQFEFTLEFQDEAALSGLSVDPDRRNNRQLRVVNVEDDPHRILYVEGEPRWEYKFLRRAVEHQASVQLVSLLRTSANKFYRQGVRDADELADGFPATAERLFEYDAVIIGSLEAAELSVTQQAALRDFVSIRGGTLLMLGGRHGLADGGWGRSVMASALPVLLDTTLDAQTFERVRTHVRPTLSGYRTEWLRLAGADAENQQAWQGLPALADLQHLGQVKPGAVVLLERESVRNTATGYAPLLVTQRYGRGSSLVLGTSGTWRWQMGLPSDDERHERFWQQLTAMLVDNVLTRLTVDAGDRVYRDTDSARLTVTAYEPDFTSARLASLPVQLTLPDGTQQRFDLPADPQLPGVFSDEIPTSMDGPYALSALMQTGGESAPRLEASDEFWWIQESNTAESFNAVQQRDFLQRVADVTGGSYLGMEDSDELLAALSRKNAALTRELQLPLWNMPFFFFCLFVAKALEWLLRLRWKRL